MQLNVKTHESFKVAKPEVGLLCKGMMASLSEIFGTELNISFVLLLVKVLADFHYGVKVLPLSEDLNCFFELLGLLIKRGSFFPVTGIVLKLGLFYQDCRIEQKTFSRFTDFLKKLVGLIKLLHGCKETDSLIVHFVLEVEGCCLLVLSLKSKNLALKPHFVKILHSVHSLSKHGEVDKFEVADSAEGFFGKSPVFSLETLDSQSSPVLLSYAETSKFVSHGKVFLFEESEESR